MFADVGVLVDLLHDLVVGRRVLLLDVELFENLIHLINRQDGSIAAFKSNLNGFFQRIPWLS